LVAYTDIETVLVLSPYEMPSDQRIAAIADAHFNTALANLKILPDVDFKAYIERKAGKFFQAYGFVAREGEEDEEAASAAAAAVAEAASAADSEEAAASAQAAVAASR
jgi:hypothetical protein